MKEVTRLTLDALGKIHEYFAGIESTGNPRCDYIEVCIFHRSSPCWYLAIDLSTREFMIECADLAHKIDAVTGEKKYFTKIVQYRMKYTEFEKENFDEDINEDFLEIAQYLVTYWSRIKKVFVSKYTKSKTEGHNLINVLEKFEA